MDPIPSVEALEAFNQRDEYLLDREYISACRHYAARYDRDDAFDIWQAALNRYAPYIRESNNTAHCSEDRTLLAAALTDDHIRASLLRLADRIPVYALMRSGGALGLMK